jgi:hypothetical protein
MLAGVIPFAAAAHAQVPRPIATPAAPPAPPAPAQPASAPTPAETPAAKPSTPAAPPTSLDDLLGITPEKPAPKGKPVSIAPDRAELERKLTPGQAADQFKQAVDLMGQTAERLQASKDTGLATQRLQEDILRRLDMVIHSAEQQQQQSQSKSKQQQQQQDQDQQQQGKQEQQRQDASSNPAPDTINPPTRREGPLSPDLAARGAAWGSLPDRMRESILQGNFDKYSSMYQRWTEAYYKKLAEEGNK